MKSELILMLKEVFILFTLPLISLCLKITRFEVPSHVAPGESVTLLCTYHLDKGKKLYSLKWYKDKREFFRYFPTLRPPLMAFPAPGVDIDVSKSGPHSVHLQNLSLVSEGQYTCQVSEDEPHFGCVQVHQDVIVYIPPETSPSISGGDVADFADNLTVHCSSAKSRPAAKLSWYVNDILIDSYVIRDTQQVTRHPDHLESSSSSISIPITSRHLPPGDTLRVTCSASIGDVVTSRSNELLVRRPLLPEDRVLELKNRGLSTLFAENHGVFIMVFVVLYLCV